MDESEVGVDEVTLEAEEVAEGARRDDGGGGGLGAEATLDVGVVRGGPREGGERLGVVDGVAVAVGDAAGEDAELVGPSDAEGRLRREDDLVAGGSVSESSVEADDAAAARVDESEGVVEGLEAMETTVGSGSGLDGGEDGLRELRLEVSSVSGESVELGGRGVGRGVGGPSPEVVGDLLEPVAVGVEEAEGRAVSVVDEVGALGEPGESTGALDGEGDVEVVGVEEAEAESGGVSLLEESEPVVDEGGGPGLAAGQVAGAGQVSGEEDAVGAVGVGE